MYGRYEASPLKSSQRPESICSGCSGCDEPDVYSRSVTLSVRSFDRQSFSSSDKDVQSLFDSKTSWDDLGYTPVPSPSPPLYGSRVSSPQLHSECSECMHDIQPTPLASRRHHRGELVTGHYGFETGRSGYEYGIQSAVAPHHVPAYPYYAVESFGPSSYSNSRYYPEYHTHRAGPVRLNPTECRPTPMRRAYPRTSSVLSASPQTYPLPPPPALPAREWLGGNPPFPPSVVSSSTRSLNLNQPSDPSVGNAPLSGHSIPKNEEEPPCVPSDLNDVEAVSFDWLINQNLCKLAFRREGSLQLQKSLPNMCEYEKEVVLNTLMTVLVSLSCNAYGNYVVQQLIDDASVDQRRSIAHVLGREIVALSMNIHGYCVVNKLIEAVHVETQIKLLERVTPHIKEMCLHEYAAQVMICFIANMPPLFLHPVTTTFCGRSWFFATHSTSHRVLTTLIDKVTAIKRNELISEIANFVVQLSKDPVGNYVVQHILGAPAECGAVAYIRMQLVENFYLLSLNKIASHVVEKLLQTSSRSELESTVEWVVGSSNKKLIKLINSPFGNYVMKTLTELASRGQRRRLAGRVEPITTRVRCSPFLKHLRELQVL